ncbi:MAG TPA: ABC transporter transmembrane domain-containing protein, partial [Nocardioides sp.]|nr:ABC transporter transmembrane domain-containing protein [Nocardioides sp.]
MTSAPAKMKETERVVSSGPMPGRGPMGGGMVGQKAMDFGPSAKRLLRRMVPERFKAAAVVVLAIGSVTLMALGPRLLGHATDLVFAGFLGRQLPDGISKDQAVAAAETRGDDQFADLLRGVDLVPGQGVDFDAVRNVLLLVLAVYVAASLLAWLQGYLLNDVVQSVVRRMRSDVEDKVNSLPLPYF